MGTSDNSTSRSKDARVVTYLNRTGGADQRGETFSILERMNVLDDNKLCLYLVADLTERVGYQCAGRIGTVTVAELMLMSVRALELAEQVD